MTAGCGGGGWVATNAAKSFPFGLAARGALGDATVAVTSLADRDEASAGEPGTLAELGDCPGGANMRLRSLPFPLGGAIVLFFFALCAVLRIYLE